MTSLQRKKDIKLDCGHAKQPPRQTRTLLVVPAYNEEETIEEVVRRSMNHVQVCVVDDGSRDRTVNIIEKIEGVHIIRHAKNTQFVGAITDGMGYALSAGYDFVITMDAGLSHNPDELPCFLTARGDADLVIGARDSAQIRGTPLYRRMLSKTGTFLMNSILTNNQQGEFKRLHDCTSGFRRYSRRAIEVIIATSLQSLSFGFLLESLVVISRAGLLISEVPISYTFSKSSLSLMDILGALRTWWYLRLAR